jgi:hypothetical protein
MSLIQIKTMTRPSFELADIFIRYGDQYLNTHPVSFEQLKVMNLIRVCRTAVLGGHMEKCDHCGFERPAYNSCRNRHCPKCQTMAKEQWLNNRRTELLPVGYFHVVFTLPHDLNPVILCNKTKLLGLLFESVNWVLSAFAKDPQWRLEGHIGFVAVLHTWTQTLMGHFHLHCLIPAGALSFDKTTWRKTRKKFLFGIQALAKAFKRRYIRGLKRLYEKNELSFPEHLQRFASLSAFSRLINDLQGKKWIAYAKRPFAGPEQVLNYLGRYTHRVAISNNRILFIDGGQVVFSYRDRADNNRQKIKNLSATEFIRRFLLHVLPDGFVKIRYFGFLSHRNKKRCIPLIRNLIDPNAKPPGKIKETAAQTMLRVTGIDITCCPACKQGRMRKWAAIIKEPATYQNVQGIDSS